MFSIRDDDGDGDGDGPEWEDCMLMNLLLLSAHIRCFRPSMLAEGGALAVRPLLIELCRFARGAKWLFDARVVQVRFKELSGNSENVSRKRLEMICSNYFVGLKKGAVSPFRAKTHDQAPPLVHQLARYCLHGTTYRRDEELAAVHGCTH